MIDIDLDHDAEIVGGTAVDPWPGSFANDDWEPPVLAYADAFPANL